MPRPRKRPTALDFWEKKQFDHDVAAESDSDIAAPEEQEQEQEALEYNSDDSIDDLEPERHSATTTVSPFIARLGERWFRHLEVAGSALRKTIDSVTTQSLKRMPEYINYMAELGRVVHESALNEQPVFREEHRLRGRAINGKRCRSQMSYYREIKYRDVIYQTGHFAIVQAGEDSNNLRPDFDDLKAPQRHLLFSDYFWICRILHIKRESQTVHVQWMQHSAKTLLAEVAHPQELFVTNLCQDIPIKTLVGRVNCVRVGPGERTMKLRHSDFFFSMSAIQPDGVFRSTTKAEEEPTACERLGGCLLCDARDKAAELANDDCTKIKLGDATFGFEKQGELYHCCDVVLLQKTSGPAAIGYIKEIKDSARYFELQVQVFERMSDTRKKLRSQGQGPKAEEFEDRQLVLTENLQKFTSSDIVGRVYVLHQKRADFFSLEKWLASPSHFFFSHSAESKEKAFRHSLVPKDAKDHLQCEICLLPEGKKALELAEWRQRSADNALRIFDPFAGCGAFVLGLCELGNMRFTHAIEICPSTAETLRRNCPDTIVFNQCSNRMLKYAMTGIFENNDNRLDDDVSLPPKPGDIDCIVTGFPCQPHSSLNRFKDRDDPLNEQYLNVVSWVDHLRPKYCVFENVQGFVDHRIGDVFSNRHVVREGVKQGGIKFVVKALTAMGYQVRFGLLQAAHYGTPQTRVRFFLMSARAGLPLPEFPQPTHNFGHTRYKAIRMSNGDIIKTFSDQQGISPLQQITVADAISDLKRWDWANPHGKYKEDPWEKDDIRRRGNVPQVKSRYKEKFASCGPEGDAMGYEHDPVSAFQARCRRRAARELQHFTRCLKDEIVERTCNISLGPNANHHDWQNRPALWDYQTMDPRSASGRMLYKNKMYQRLDHSGFFQTIVTHVVPTAKQSRVLNPWCHRMLTVRELARAQGFPDDFRFTMLDGKVTTLHRMIGNAVPWPLGEALGRELEKSWRADTVLADESD